MAFIATKIGGKCWSTVEECEELARIQEQQEAEQQEVGSRAINTLRLTQDGVAAQVYWTVVSFSFIYFCVSTNSVEKSTR